jgi:hypothetical protein
MLHMIDKCLLCAERLYLFLVLIADKKAGHSKKTARTGAVTLIQRFGSALNLNIHFNYKLDRQL